MDALRLHMFFVFDLLVLNELKQPLCSAGDVIPMAGEISQIPGSPFTNMV